MDFSPSAITNAYVMRHYKAGLLSILEDAAVGLMVFGKLIPNVKHRPVKDAEQEVHSSNSHSFFQDTGFTDLL